MCPIQNRSTSDSESHSDSEDRFAKQSVGKKSEISYTSLIKLANKRTNLLHILQKVYGLQIAHNGQFDEWSRPIKCPFPAHKGGSERTPSFGYNFIQNRFNCFGCSNSGGSVEFLSLMENVQKHLVAGQLVRDTGGYDADDEEENENPKIDKLLFDFSSNIQQLYKKHQNNDLVLNQIEKVTWWFDLYLLNKVPKNKIFIDELTQRIEKANSLLEKYL